MKAFERSLILSAALATCLLTFMNTASAAIITQTFVDSWTVSPWDYYGDVAAMEWAYTPYTIWNSSLGTLQEVQLSTQITGSRALASEPVHIRYAFITGWAPDYYQFYNELTIAAGNANFTLSRNFDFTGTELQNWLTHDYYPPANYYFESRTVEAQHTILATTTLNYVYKPAPVPEPATLGLFGLGLAAIGFRYRRHHKSVNHGAI